MSPAEVNWIPALIVLAVGLVVGAVIVFRSRSTARAAELPPGKEIEVRDLEARRDALIDELRELELSGPKASVEEAGRARAAMELEAARILMELDRRGAAAAPKAKSAQAKAAPAAGSTIKGFLWGVGSVGAIGLLLYLASQSAEKKQAGQEPMTGGAPAPAATPLNDAETLRLRAEIDKNPQNLDARLDLARHALLHNDMMAVFAETRAVLDRRPDDPRALTYQAVVRLAMGQAKMAEDMLKRAMTSAPDLEDAHVYLMLLYTETGRPGEADQALAHAQKLLPTEAASLADMLQRMRSEVAERGGPMPAESGQNPHAALEKPGAPAAGPGPAATPVPAPAMTQTPSAGGREISGVIELDAHVTAPPSPRAVVWLLLRSSGQRSGSPLAVKRLPPSFPQRFAIGAADSMTGDTIPDRVRIEARLDADGDAATRDPNDPVAAVDNVKMGATDLHLRLTPQP